MVLYEEDVIIKGAKLILQNASGVEMGRVFSDGDSLKIEAEDDFYLVQQGSGKIQIRPKTGYRLQIYGDVGELAGFLNDGLDSEVTFSQQATLNVLPSGVILIWSGAPAAIPAGWVLCDGNNGTPDLSDKFIKGTTQVAHVGNIGGSATHYHVSPSGKNGSEALNSTCFGSVTANGTYTYNSLWTRSGSFKAGKTSTVSGEPEYYQLCFIMKIV